MEPEMYFDFSPQQHTKALLTSADATHATFVVDYVLTFDAYLQALNSTLGRSFSQVGTCTRYLRLLLTVLISISSTADCAQLAVLPHAYFDYDYDDPHPKKTVYVFKRQHLKMHVEIPPGTQRVTASAADATAGITNGDEAADSGSDQTPTPQPSTSTGTARSHAHAPFNNFVAAGATPPPLFPLL
jgi:hypothetical protein